ncbi:hypothetical protein EJ04DRAFT_522829 [Polyplosphaeria fusca]|uniref:Uncharacterized protein n=1 Tax=Polyplosphaeria fusca TaxID=682080 RepID=A0A9P4V2D9_9PLEO|nr:hypothetical protein EJ04DRAFT_522829 [Polyplosphaeria fusca]
MQLEKWSSWPKESRTEERDVDGRTERADYPHETTNRRDRTNYTPVIQIPEGFVTSTRYLGLNQCSREKQTSYESGVNAANGSLQVDAGQAAVRALQDRNVGFRVSAAKIGTRGHDAVTTTICHDYFGSRGNEEVLGHEHDDLWSGKWLA